MRAYRLVDLYTKSFMASKDPARVYRSSRRPLRPSSLPSCAPHLPFSFTPIPCPKTGCAVTYPIPPGSGGEPSGNLANTDVSGVYTRDALTNHSTLYAALTLSPPPSLFLGRSPSSASSEWHLILLLASFARPRASVKRSAGMRIRISKR